MKNAGSELPDDVKVEEVSDTVLRVTVGDLTTDVSVERIYRTDVHFGEFRSLDRLIEVLRKISKDPA